MAAYDISSLEHGANDEWSSPSGTSYIGVYDEGGHRIRCSIKITPSKNCAITSLKISVRVAKQGANGQLQGFILSESSDETNLSSIKNSIKVTSNKVLIDSPDLVAYDIIFTGLDIRETTELFIHWANMQGNAPIYCYLVGDDKFIQSITITEEKLNNIYFYKDSTSKFIAGQAFVCVGLNNGVPSWRKAEEVYICTGKDGDNKPIWKKSITE